MQIFKADSSIVNEGDFEELEKGLVYIDRKDGFIALVDSHTSDTLLVELEIPVQSA